MSAPSGITKAASFLPAIHKSSSPPVRDGASGSDSASSDVGKTLELTRSELVAKKKLSGIPKDSFTGWKQPKVIERSDPFAMFDRFAEQTDSLAYKAHWMSEKARLLEKERSFPQAHSYYIKAQQFALGDPHQSKERLAFYREKIAELATKIR